MEENITERNQKIVDFYELELEKDANKSIENTMKKYNLSHTQVRDILRKYSQYPTPTVYKRAMKDIKAVSSIVADEILDEGFNIEHGGVITSPEMERAIKHAEKLGYDTKEGYIKYLEHIIKNKIEETTNEDIIAIQKGKPLEEVLPKPIQYRVREKEAEAKIKEAEARIKRAESNIISEDSVRHFIRGAENYLVGDGNNGNKGSELFDLYYDADYEEMYNDYIELNTFLATNYNKRSSHALLNSFIQKWAFRISKAEELKELKAKKEREKLMRYYDSFDDEALIELYNRRGADF